MSAQPLGELWICLRPNEDKLKDCGSRLSYQQIIIHEIIEQFGFDKTVFLLKTTEGRDRIPVVQQQLHHLVHLHQEKDYIIIRDVPEVREDRLYRYSWSEGTSIRAITFTTE